MKSHINPKYSHYSDILENIPNIFSSQGNTLIKKRNEIKEIRCGDTAFIVKKYKAPNLPGKIKYLFTGICKARKAYKYSIIFNENGLNTPEGISYTTVCKNGLLRDSYFVTVRCPGVQLQREMLYEKGGEAIVDAIIEEIYKMHEKGIMHGDLNLSNIFIEHNAGKWKIHFIDINRSYLCKNPTKEHCAKNMFRLNHDRPTLTLLSKAYARRRNWDEDEYSAAVLRHLSRFEAKKRFLKKFKRKK